MAIAIGNEEMGAVGGEHHRSHVVADRERRSLDLGNGTVALGAQRGHHAAAADIAEGQEEAAGRVQGELLRPAGSVTGDPGASVSAPRLPTL